MYRDALNSFNFSLLLTFRRKANVIAESMSSTKNKGIDDKTYGKKISRKTAVTFFIDAIWDAYNRPIRGEPMFGQASQDVLGDAVEFFEKISIKLENILIATADFSKNELWFPIDINNYLFASNYDVSDDKLSNDEKTKINNELNSYLNAIKYNKTSTQSTRPYYIDLCRKLLEDLAQDHPQYPFDVSCKDVDGLENNILMLHFNKKQLTSDE